MTMIQISVILAALPRGSIVNCINLIKKNLDFKNQLKYYIYSFQDNS